jgi:hypothetical protein
MVSIVYLDSGIHDTYTYRLYNIVVFLNFRYGQGLSTRGRR